jgi:hypothetical protein
MPECAAGSRAAVSVVLLVLACDGGSAELRSDPPDAASDVVNEPVQEAGDGSLGPLGHRFRRVVLSTEFLCEGAAFGDFDRNGAIDVVAGPYWYEGPTFATAHEIYAPAPFDPRNYSNNFFAWVWDFDADGWDDVLFVGFPGADATWYRNPAGAAGSWARHQVFDVVDNESPWFTDLTGDGKPELVFNTGGRLGWAEPDWAAPEAPWAFHALSAAGGFFQFTHGLGAGDVDGDGRADLLEATGFWRQPASLAGDPIWARQNQAFGQGGAQIFTDDVDADGDADVITTLQAHGYGLSWFEQQRDGTAISFVEHVIVPPSEPTGEVFIHEPHALVLHDIDGDGDRDIVTGERFWGHVPQGSPDFAAPARTFWFELVRANGTVGFEPHLADDASGVGTQVVVGDVTGDGLPDIVSANKKGAFVLVHEVYDLPSD